MHNINIPKEYDKKIRKKMVQKSDYSVNQQMNGTYLFIVGYTGSPLPYSPLIDKSYI